MGTNGNITKQNIYYLSLDNYKVGDSNWCNFNSRRDIQPLWECIICINFPQPEIKQFHNKFSQRLNNCQSF